MKKLKFLSAMMPMAILVSGCGRAGVVETRNLAWPAMDGQVLSVSTFNGSISVSTGEGDSIRAVATIGTSLGVSDAGSVEISFVPGLATSLVASRQDPLSDANVSFEITVPAGVSIGDLETSNGDVTLDGMRGHPVIDTSNGDVTLKDFTGSVRIDTSNGHVTAEGPGLVVERIDTSNGDVEVTVSGFQPGASISSSNGDITITLDHGSAASFDFDTSLGDITVTGPGFSMVEIDDGDGSATFGSNGPSVSVSTSNGGITLISPGE